LRRFGKNMALMERVIGILGGGGKTVLIDNVVGKPRKGRRKISAAGRKRIAAAQRAKLKAAKKK
jgi:ABC-type transporter Mla maintaining outer membrane lipid asymmetry ATPase subunit MlaF